MGPIEDNQYNEVAKGEFVLSSAGDYVQVPDGEPLKMHISSVKKILAKKYGSEELEEKLAVGFKLDEDIEGKGQVYTSWYRPSLSPKANLTKLIVALYGKIPATLDVTELVGMPVRATLTRGEDDSKSMNRQFVDTYLKPSSDQKKVVVEPSEPEEINLDEIFASDPA